LKAVDELYVSDAYNSLSIEGYKVSAELIERVRTRNWNPETNANDRENHDALAARGYWQAFQAVKQTVERVLAGENGGVAASADYARWYTELFAPGVTAGIFRPADLAGFRTGPVFIRLSMHVPPNAQAVRDLMPAFFELLEQEREPAVRAVLGHFVFVYIHPYFDGNGRMGRFLMNTMMASGGYPWTVIPLAERKNYMDALEAASVGQDIQPFAAFIGNLLRKSGA
jgi:Fic family protein